MDNQTELRKNNDIRERTYINYTKRNKKTWEDEPILFIFKEPLKRKPAKDQEIIETLEKEEYEKKYGERI